MPFHTLAVTSRKARMRLDWAELTTIINITITKKNGKQKTDSHACAR